MIVFLSGKAVEKEPSFVVLENQGIGYYINISLHTFSDIKGEENIRLYTYLQIREDAHILYGFSKKSEKIMFEHLINVNGVGPSTAMVILSCLSVAELHTAIVTENVTALQAIKGIGKKSAQRVVLELKDTLNKGLGVEIAKISGEANNIIHHEALAALTALGISRSVAEKSIGAVLKKSAKTLSLEELVKLALKGF